MNYLILESEKESGTGTGTGTHTGTGTIGSRVKPPLPQNSVYLCFEPKPIPVVVPVPVPVPGYSIFIPF